MSDNNGLKISRRKALAGIGGIGVASAGAGLGTSAYFTDTESFEGNSITAGELDLRIDWQQLYYGPDSNTDNYKPYGSAGYPFVNAHPDHDTDGMQSLNLSDFDEGEFADEDGEVTYMDDVEDPENGSNIQEYLTCGTLDNFEIPSDFDNGIRTQQHLIELNDIKPGDSGEITFSFHLCDNPGYVWFMGEGGDIQDDLADEIIVQAWYDLNCDNIKNGGETVILDSPTNLRNFISRLDGGYQMKPSVYGDDVPISTGTDTSTDTSDCLKLERIEWGENGPSLDDGKGTIEVSQEDPLEYKFDLEDDGTRIVILMSDIWVKSDGGVEQAMNEQDYDLGEIVQYDWAIDPAASDDTGICEKRTKAGNNDPQPDGDFGRSVLEECTLGEKEVNSPTKKLGGGEFEKAEDDDPAELLGISYIEFHYCPSSGPTPTLCFPENETFCMGFSWYLPVDAGRVVDDINELQGQSVSFDLGFYTEQCRHNEDPNGPSGSPE